MPRNRLPRIIKTADQHAEETKEDHRKDCGTGTGPKVAQFHLSFILVVILGYFTKECL